MELVSESDEQTRAPEEATVKTRCLEVKFKKERAKQKNVDSPRGRAKQLISAPKKRRAVMFCVMS